MSAGQLARHRSSSAGTRPVVRSNTPVNPQGDSVEAAFQACAATASIFLFAQGHRVLCLHHDTLAIERKFERHKEPVVLLSVDNVSERGSGRLVVSYDAGQTAIVWDLFTGDEIARFASYEPLKVAAWMKDGNVAFGNSQGNVILFEPPTSEHKSARTIFDPITALAPASDCQTYAIGYQNGSILIATLLPTFTILHTLSTSRSPSAIVGLAWHASSTKQKSDMLAVQSADGDLRVWSIAKPPTVDQPKVIRVLKRGDNVESGLNWIAWSKNGRILQFSQGETWSWDVRTKHVNYEPIPTVEGVTALANHGPTATLFTLGPDHSVQQYDLSPPALTKNVRYDPSFTPTRQIPSAQTTPKINQHGIPGAAPPIPLYTSQQSSHNPASLSTIQQAASEMQAVEHARQLRADMASPMSTASMTESISSRSSAGLRQRNAPSVSSRAASGTTFSTFSPSMLGRDSFSGIGSTYFPRTTSIASSGRRSKGSRLRQEVVLSPETQILDLFPYTRARLASLPYSPQPPQALDQTKASPSELRRQMLQIVFGWDGDIEPMIRDELSNHPVGSMNVTLLSKWLGEVQVDSMAAVMGEAPLSSTDWMLLALSQMNGQGSAAKQLGHSMVQRLLQQGDIHTAATILLGLGDREDAVEIYVSRCYYMEGILLTCLLFPDEWQRQAHLVRRWGEYVVENSQQHLAIRCFSCTGVDTSVAWASPNQSPFTGMQPPPNMPQIISPPTSPPPQANKQSAASRMTTKNSSLKLITSFGGDSNQYKFPGLKSDDRTPTNAPGITPIAESALSPGGTPSAYLRPQLRTRNNGPKTPGGYGRHRLPSIGETPIDVIPPPFPISRPGSRVNALPTPNDSGSDREKDKQSNIVAQEANLLPNTGEEAPLTLSSARYDPSAGEATPQHTPQTALPSTAIRTNMAPPTTDRFAAMQEKSRTRNGSRDRKPDGLHIHMPSLNQVNLNAIATSSSDKSVSLDHRRSNTWSSLHSNGSLSSGHLDTRSDTRSPPVTGQSWNSSMKSPSVSGRSVDQYISSLEEAQFYSHKHKESRRHHRSREGRTNASGIVEHKSRSKGRHREPSEDRGRSGVKYIRPAKRSPSSPVPMSPEDLQRYRDANSQSIGSTLSLSRNSSPEAPPLSARPHSSRRKPASKVRSQSKTSGYSHSTVRRMSPNGFLDSQAGSEVTSKMSSRMPSPDGILGSNGRGRSQSKHGGSSLRSPSSPLPMSPQVRPYQPSEDDDNPLRLVEANQQRLRSAQRSTSRRPRERGTSARRDLSPDRRRTPEPRAVYQSLTTDISTDQKTSDGEKLSSDSNAPGLRRTKSQRTLKKEMAARELEARRESLMQRDTAPQIPLPSSLSLNGGRPSMATRSQTDLSNSPTSNGWTRVTPPMQQYGDAFAGNELNPENRCASTGPSYGLPSTPRAMRHPKYGSRDEDIPAVPELPDSFYQAAQDLPRSMSAPVPDIDVSLPSDMPRHPAFHQGLRPSTKRPNFSPLGDIGRQRRTPSLDVQQTQSSIASIDATLHEADIDNIIVVPDHSQYPPILPELQHLANPLPPPPPPPPPHPAFRNDDHTNSISSGSGVGTINIVMDDISRNGTPIIDVANPMPPETSKSPQIVSPPMPSSGSVDSSSMHSHRRGRSIDHFGNKLKGITDRMRSTSRGRNNGKSPKVPYEPLIHVPSPYESLPEYF
ncbi:hypothetical protein MMC11_003945 [Xylographa trunciseda]|nr:hypothetical protein [Xylographa trunciseda]